MRISKENLLKVISEQEVDEFAYIKKGTQDTTNKIPKHRPFWFPENEGNPTPDGWWINPSRVAGEEKLYLFLNGQAQVDFENANQEFLDSVEEQTGKELIIVNRKKVKEHPRNKMVGTTYVPSGNKKPEQTKIRIEFNRIVDEILCSEEVNSRLDKLSIPQIKSRDKKHINRWTTASNDKIEYETHSYEGYLSAAQFLDFVTARITNQPLQDSVKSYHLARQFNKIYSNWDDTTKHHDMYKGKTDAYKLDKFGLDEDNMDVCVRTDLKIKGYKMLNANTFQWHVDFTTEFGRKLKSATWMNGLNPNNRKSIVKTVEIDPQVAPYLESGEKTIIDVLSVRTALIEALTELRDTFFNEYKPVGALKIAKFKASDVVSNR